MCKCKCEGKRVCRSAINSREVIEEKSRLHVIAEITHFVCLHNV